MGLLNNLEIYMVLKRKEVMIVFPRIQLESLHELECNTAKVKAKEKTCLL